MGNPFFLAPVASILNLYEVATGIIEQGLE
jgi:hypothetical protein